jgi:hypothetical protein
MQTSGADAGNSDDGNSLKHSFFLLLRLISSFASKVMEAMPRFQSDDASSPEVDSSGRPVSVGDDQGDGHGADEDTLRYAISGHSGDSSYIPFVRYGRPPRNEKDVFATLQAMIAHSQYCSSGDHTLEAIEQAIKRSLTLLFAPAIDDVCNKLCFASCYFVE